MKIIEEKRKKIFLSSKEVSVLKNIFIKILIPFIAVIVISSLLLFMGLEFLMKKANFCNYGIAPSTVIYGVSQFIWIYIIIFVANIILLLSLSGIIFYFMVHDLVFPIMRITDELKSGNNKLIQVRRTDMLIHPLIKYINKMTEK